MSEKKNTLTPVIQVQNDERKERLGVAMIGGFMRRLAKK
jgi:hypothetical protein